MNMPGNPSMLAARLVVEELFRKGVRLAVLCPGSRNTPLTLAFVQHGGFRLQSVIDERAAAFVALGWARASGEPAVVCTTSGSAVAHLLPAAVEADQDSLPLLLLCADRPPELLDTGSNQTVNQADLLTGVMRARLLLPCADPGRPLDWLLSAVDEAVDRTRGPHPGPVQLNLPLRKPLEPGPGTLPETWSAGLEPWLAGTHAWRAGGYGRPGIDEDSAAGLKDFLSGARRPLVLLGRTRSEHEMAAVRDMTRRLGLPLLADLLSGLRLAPREPGLLHHGDLAAALDSPVLDTCDRVLQFGGRLASPALIDWLGRRPAGCLALVEPAPRRLDPGVRQALRLTTSLARGAECVAQAWESSGATLDPDWSARLHHDDHLLEAGLAGWFDGATDIMGETWLARRLTRLLPAGHGLWAASSMAVRDLARWSGPGYGPRVLANRGASGIDGTLASALGACLATGQPLTVFCGDLALIHDLNSLLTVARSGLPLTVLVVNNNGGGIFHRLPVAQHTGFSPWVDTPHGMEFAGVCASVGLEYHAPADPVALDRVLEHAWSASAPTLIEVTCTPGAAAEFQKGLLPRLRPCVHPGEGE